MLRNVKILGLWSPIVIPICLFTQIITMRQEKSVTSLSFFNTHEGHEWLRTEWCGPCEQFTDHEYIEYRDEQVVTRQCMNCEHITSYWDAV